MLIYGITFDHTTNYGSNLQAYALQAAIERINISGEACRYQLIPLYCFDDWPGKKKDAGKQNAAAQILDMIARAWFLLHKGQFRGFQKKYLHFADVSNMNDLPLLNESADAFVCGSDVIWNSLFNHHLGVFYLDFAQKYKFSYAASFGKSSVDDEDAELMKKYLPSFNEISCREASGCDIIEKYTGRKAFLAADPVLLIDRDEWSGIAGEKRISGKYIFVYVTHMNATIKKFIDMIEEQTRLKVVYAAWGLRQAIKMKKLLVQKPEKWLRLLRDAEYVITNSFHATAFCVLFHKKFFTVVEGDKTKSSNVRMNDFLNMLGLNDRLFSSAPDRVDINMLNYDAADAKLKAMREESLKFLRKNLEAAYQEKHRQQ